MAPDHCSVPPRALRGPTISAGKSLPNSFAKPLLPSCNHGGRLLALTPAGPCTQLAAPRVPTVPLHQRPPRRAAAALNKPHKAPRGQGGSGHGHPGTPGSLSRCWRGAGNSALQRARLRSASARTVAPSSSEGRFEIKTTKSKFKSHCRHSSVAKGDVLG